MALARILNLVIHHKITNRGSQRSIYFQFYGYLCYYLLALVFSSYSHTSLIGHVAHFGARAVQI